MILANYRTSFFPILLSILFCFSGVKICLADSEYISPDILKQDINSRNIDKMIETFNLIKQMRYQGDILRLLDDLWNNRTEKHSSLAWDIVGKDIIRIEIADILIQAHNNGKLKADVSSIHRYVTSSLKSDDKAVQTNALLIIMNFDDKNDVKIIHDIAKEQSKGTFKAAIYALSYMCNNEASKSLNELKRIVSSKNKKVIQETQSRIGKIKKSISTCSQ